MNINTILIGVGGIGVVYTLLKHDLAAPAKAIVDVAVDGGKIAGDMVKSGAQTSIFGVSREQSAALWKGFKSLWGYSPTKEQVAKNVDVEGFSERPNIKNIFENYISEAAPSTANLPTISDEWN